MAIAYQHVREDPIPPSQLDPSIPQYANAIVLKALTKDANYRYQSASEMRADIQRALQGMPVSAPTMAMNAGTQVMPSGQRTQAMRGPSSTMGYDLPPARYAEPEREEGRGKQIAIWSIVGLLAVGAIVAYGQRRKNQLYDLDEYEAALDPTDPRGGDTPVAR